MELDTSLAERRVRALEQIASVLRWSAAAAGTALVIWLLGDVLLVVFAAALLALGLRGLAERMARASGISVGAAFAVVVVTLVAVLGLGAWLAGPRLASEASQLQDQMLRQMAALRSWLDVSPWARWLSQQLPADLGGTGQPANLVPRISGTIAGALWSAIGLLGTVVLVIAAALYFAAAPAPYVNGPLHLVAQRYRLRTRQVIATVAGTLQSWLAGQLLDMCVVGVAIGGGLGLLGVPLPFILGATAALLNFVPYIGALSQSPQQALLVGALFLVVQTLEGNILSPLIQRQAVHLPPAATLLAQTALGALFGVPGIIFATPAAAAILAALREVTSDSA
jgi:predicted PurR-regulated permease PerM